MKRDIVFLFPTRSPLLLRFFAILFLGCYNFLRFSCLWFFFTHFRFIEFLRNDDSLFKSRFLFLLFGFFLWFFVTIFQILSQYLALFSFFLLFNLCKSLLVLLFFRDEVLLSFNFWFELFRLINLSSTISAESR